MPTVSTDTSKLRENLLSILASKPSCLILVTTKAHAQAHQELCESIGASNLKILISSFTSKRLQLCIAIPLVKTLVTVLTDDDVVWPDTILPWLLAPFEDSKIGGVGTSQRIRRISGTLRHMCYEFLGAAYIERRNFEISATHNTDGGTSCMSGRTHALRTEILQDSSFLLGFMTEKWQHRLLKADDDNFISRWLVAKSWNTWIQYNSECEVETTLECDDKFLSQCLRWARSNWRSNWTSLSDERHVWRKVKGLLSLLYTNFDLESNLGVHTLYTSQCLQTLLLLSIRCCFTGAIS